MLLCVGDKWTAEVSFISRPSDCLLFFFLFCFITKKSFVPFRSVVPLRNHVLTMEKPNELSN
jgi:hypothetical protein